MHMRAPGGQRGSSRALVVRFPGSRLASSSAVGVRVIARSRFRVRWSTYPVTAISALVLEPLDRGCRARAVVVGDVAEVPGDLAQPGLQVAHLRPCGRRGRGSRTRRGDARGRAGGQRRAHLLAGSAAGGGVASGVGDACRGGSVTRRLLGHGRVRRAVAMSAGGAGDAVPEGRGAQEHAGDHGHGGHSVHSSTHGAHPRLIGLVTRVRRTATAVRFWSTQLCVREAFDPMHRVTHVTRADLDKKPAEVQAMFDDVAPRYDLTNDVLSLGQDRRWRQQVVDAVDPRPGDRVLDLAAGTGTSSQPFHDRGATVVPVRLLGRHARRWASSTCRTCRSPRATRTQLPVRRRDLRRRDDLLRAAQHRRPRRGSARDAACDPPRGSPRRLRVQLADLVAASAPSTSST